jgi:tetratricopeptide (TPR) repeat protein
MATVYLARQASLDRPVALKILSADLARDPQFVERFQREARTAASLEHPNIVQIYDVGQTDGVFYIAMRYVAGITLADLLQTEGRLRLDRAIGLLTQIAAALDYAHDGPAHVIHRDLKPGNVLVESGDRATLVDFGIAQASSATRLTRYNSMIGTPEYMAPEQIEGHSLAPTTDLYALGIIAYELLAGREPFRSDVPTGVLYQQVHAPMPSLRALRPDVPAYVEAAIQRMLSKKPQDRFRSGNDFVRALSGSVRVSVGRDSHPRAAVLVAGAAAAVLAGLVISAATLASGSASGMFVSSVATVAPLAASIASTPTIDAPATAVATQPATIETPASTTSLEGSCRTALANVDGVWSSNIGDAAILLEHVRATDPTCHDDSGTVTDKLYAAYVALGQQYVDMDQSDLAVTQFDKAINLAPSRSEAPVYRMLATTYHDGLVARGRGDVDQAIDRLGSVVQSQRDYARGRALSALADLYLARADNRSAGGQLQAAQADVDQVLGLQPDNSHAAQLRQDLRLRLAPATSTPVPAPPVTDVTSISLGTSVGGRSMTAARIGNGPVRLGITGSLHGGRELSAYQFLQWLSQTLQTDPAQVPSQLTVYVLPTADPDDVGRATGFNLNGVDINRNFPMNWRAETCGAPGGRYGPTGCKANGGGSTALSEPESRAVRALVQDQQLVCLLIVNSGLSVISSRNGGGGIGEPVARRLSGLTGLPYVPTYTAYPVTGQLVDWVESLGKMGVEVNMPATFANDRGYQVVQSVFEYLAQ